MRITNGNYIAQIGELSARRADKTKAAALYKSDAVDVGRIGADARAADMDVRQTQNTMTLFRIAEDSLMKIESAFVRLSELADGVTYLSPAERNTAATEAIGIYDEIKQASRATMGGVSIFGTAPVTEAMWGVAADNAVTLAESDRDPITAIPSLGAFVEDAAKIRVTDEAATISFYNTATKVGAARETMTREAVLMGDAAMTLAYSALEDLRKAASSPYVGASLMSFVADNLEADD